ncbi:MAG TPA: hypothetical protein ENN79_06200 [Desulfobacteraceae bacterium]|nr:hypothetical protein [Desulfobacteraceae bacterium]
MYTKPVGKISYIFNHEGIRTIFVNFRYPICLAFLILILPQIKPEFLLPGFLVSLFGELIQVWCFASLDKNRSLAVRGPYSLTRNPMYIGRFFLLLGGVLLIGEIWIIPVFIMIYYFYLTNRVRREETNLHVIFQEEYQSYCSKVNRFVPSFKRVNLKPLFYFNWRLFLQNNGNWNLSGVLIIYLLFYFITFIKTGAQ